MRNAVWTYFLFVNLIVPYCARADSIVLFDDAGIQFNGSASFVGQDVVVRDNGRRVEYRLELPEFDSNARLVAKLNVIANEDPWDRGGNISFRAVDGQTYELHKFITGFGGTSEHETDITSLAAALKGNVLVRAFVDTWVSDAWQIDFQIQEVFDQPVGSVEHPSWNRALLSPITSFRDSSFASGPRRTRPVEIPTGLDRIELRYFASGHATDGSGGDEFQTRRHSISIDGKEIASIVPWRDDCRAFRNVNPTSGRFGRVWSSDLSRSGWCPGDDVEPYVFDVTEFVTPGEEHIFEFLVDGIRPQDSSGEGYWRVSSYLAGFGQIKVPGDCDGDGEITTADLTCANGTELATVLSTLDLLAGDFNGINGVDFADFLVLSANFGAKETTYPQGDANGDSEVNFSDFLILSDNFGRSSAATVPEPTATRLLLIGFLLLVGRRFPFMIANRCATQN